MNPYNRIAALAYALRWARYRNPRFYDFSDLGGDCTNFASQCLYAGTGVMNFSQINGWYYVNLNDRSPSWTGAQFLNDFLTTNTGPGPVAQLAELSEAETGDIIQLQDANGRLYHSLVVLNNTDSDILVAAHTDDSLLRPLSSYSYANAILLHILGYRP